MNLAAPAAAFSPLLPDPDQAREWAEKEFADPAYQAAEPTLIDRASRAVARFVNDLLQVPQTDGWGPAVLVVLGVLVVAAIVVGILIWGRPRTSVRAAPAARALFDDDDTRSADELRAEAEAAAQRDAWDDAVVLRFRAVARGLAERGLVDPPPGATVRAFARAASDALPALSAGLEAAATTFDDVRYLRRPGTRERYALIVDLDDAAVRARPAPVGTT